MFYIIKNKTTNKLITITGYDKLKNHYENDGYKIETFSNRIEGINSIFKQIYGDQLKDLIFLSPYFQ